jgi:hypothetical protein
MSTLILRLASGEELIGNVTMNEGDGSYTIKKAHILLPMGEGRMGMVPYMPYANFENGITISDIHVMFHANPVKELEAKYVEASTGIFTGSMGSPLLGSGLKLST